jgi:Hint module
VSESLEIWCFQKVAYNCCCFLQGNGIYEKVANWSGRPTVPPTPTTPEAPNTPTSPIPPRPTVVITPTTPNPPIPVATTPITPPTPTPSCFSSNNMVDVKLIGTIGIHELKIGDYVRTRNNEYTQVYGFSHINRDVEIEFLQLILEDPLRSNVEFDNPLEVTSKHLVFVERNDKFVALPASSTIVGDILNYDGKRVKEIRYVTRHGIYAPLTFSGDMIVSGALVSNHVNILDHPSNMWNQHLLGQVAWYPRRLFCRLFMDVCMKETHHIDSGHSIYAEWIVWCGSIVNQCRWIGILVVNIMFTPLIPMTTMMESMPFFGWVGVVATIIAIRFYVQYSAVTWQK